MNDTDTIQAAVKDGKKEARIIVLKSWQETTREYFMSKLGDKNILIKLRSQEEEVRFDCNDMTPL